MAVEAQRPSNIFLLMNRNDQDRKNDQMEYALQQNEPALVSSGFLERQSSSPFFLTAGSSYIHTRKRGRDSNSNPSLDQQYFPINLFSEQQQHHHHHHQQQISSPIFISQWKQQQQEGNSIVSTGLHLSSSDNQQNHHQNDETLDFSAQIDLQNNEIDRLVHSQMEQLRRNLSDLRLKHHRQLLSAAEEAAGRRMQGKAAELHLATRRNAELEERLEKLKAESAAWQAKARADEAVAAALQAQLFERAKMADDPAVADAESACVDPRREEAERGRGLCRRCCSAVASVVLFPCRHLCVCRTCDYAAAAAAAGGGSGDVCPVCGCAKTASFEVYLS